MKALKLQCIGCKEIYYLKNIDAKEVIPEGAEPGEGFLSVCPFCKERYAMLAE